MLKPPKGGRLKFLSIVDSVGALGKILWVKLKIYI